MQIDNSTAARFWARVDKTGSCWLWLGSCAPNGYGKVSIHGRSAYAHRVAYELTHGPVPVGLMVLHNCPDGDNPSCVNPAHLWSGTHLENMADMTAKGRGHKGRFNYWASGERQYSATLTDEDVREIRRLFVPSYGAAPRMARRFGVKPGVIQRVVSGRTWRHLD